MKKNQKPKAIDLGTLQDEFTSAKKELAKNANSLVKAQEAFDRSKRKYQTSEEALKNAARAVLN